MSIDFTLSEQQRAVRDGARDFSRKVLSQVRPIIQPIQKPEDRFFAIRPFYEQMVEAGFLQALIPEAYGGGGLSNIEMALAAEEFAVEDVNVPTALLVTRLGLEPILSFGTEPQKQKWVQEILEAPKQRLAAFAFSEVGGSANFDSPEPGAGLQTEARREGDEWVITGKKHFITNGCGWEGKGAHLYTVLCRTDMKKPPEESLAVIAVPGQSSGIEVPSYLDTMGHRAVSSPRIHFNEVRVPAGNLIGKVGDGIEIVQSSFSWTAAMIGAVCTGVMRAAFQSAIEFAKEDKRSGSVPIIEHQNVGFMLADIKMRIESARYLTWKACHQLDISQRRIDNDELAIMTKIYASELCVQVVYDAMRVVGVNSYTELTPLAELMQDALGYPIYDGGNMGIRRRQIHAKMLQAGYDQMAAADCR